MSKMSNGTLASSDDRNIIESNYKNAVNNIAALSISNADLSPCPDCKSVAPKKQDYYYCPICNENSSVKSLDVKAFYAEDDSIVKWLGQFLENNRILNDLALTWQSSTDDPQLTNIFSAGLRSCNNLTKLSICDMTVVKGAGQMFGEAIGSLNNLQLLHFARVKVHPDEVQYLSDGLKTNKSIQKLMIYDCAELWCILNDLFEENKSIEMLSLSEHSPGISTIDNFLDGLKYTKTLKELHIDSDYPFNRTAITSLAEGLRSNNSITSLHLVAKINNEALEILCDALKDNKTVRTLNLSGNEYTSVPATIFKISSLTDLMLGEPEHPISEGFTKEFSEALRCNKSLKRLSLQVSSNDGCRALADGLKGNDTLHQLILLLHNVDDASIRYYGSVLETHPSIENLMTGDYACQGSIIGTMVDIIKKNTKLEWIAVIGQYNDNIDRFVDALKENNTLKSLEVSITDDMPLIIYREEQFISLFEVNYSLIHLGFFGAPVEKYLMRNRIFQQEMYENNVVVIHSLARDSSMKALIPPEIWINVFKYLRYPGLRSFESIARKIFDKYK